MAISLQKGSNIDLLKTDSTLEEVMIGLGWDSQQYSGDDFDLDASVFLLDKNDKVRTDSDLCFYNNLSTGNGSVVHQGDNLVGGSNGDDEQIKVYLSKIPDDIEKLVFVVTIYEYQTRKQNFGMVSNAFVRLVNDKTGDEVVRFDLSEDASTNTSMVFAEVYRKNGSWSFKAIGQGVTGGLQELCNKYGVK